GGDEGLGEQLAGGELVGSAGPAQRGEYVELPRLEPVLRERGTPRPVQVPGQPGDPAEHFKRLDVQVGALPAPGSDQSIDLVPRRFRHAVPPPSAHWPPLPAGSRSVYQDT